MLFCVNKGVSLRLNAFDLYLFESDSATTTEWNVLYFRIEIEQQVVHVFFAPQVKILVVEIR